MQKMTMRVTQKDVLDTKRYGLHNPILFVLQRQTGTLWRMYDDGFALEVMLPHRACQLDAETLCCWHEYAATGRLTDFELEVELHETQAQDGYSLGQQRKTSLRRDICSGDYSHVGRA